MKEYTIEIWSYGCEIGVGSVTQEQYDYWIERQDDLYYALIDGIDQEAEGVPEEAMLSDYYNDYSDIVEACGPDFENCTITVKCDGVEVYSAGIEEFLKEYSGVDNIEWLNDVNIDDLDPGYYLHWVIGGKGLYFKGSFDTEEFQPGQLRFGVTVVEGTEILSTVHYGNVGIYSDGCEWNSKYSDFNLYSV